MCENQSARIILSECERALNAIDAQQSAALIHEIVTASKVYFIGVGRVMLSLEAICKRMAHLGISAHCVGEINEPAMTNEDLLIVASGSGESIIPKAITAKAKSFGARVAWIGSNSQSSIAAMADVKVRIPVQTKLKLADELTSVQPLTSLFEQALLLFGDAIAMDIVREKKLDLDSLWECHANLE